MVGAVLNWVSPRLLALIGAALAIAGLLLLGVGSRLPVVMTGIACLGGAIAFLVAPAGTLIGVQGARTTPPALGGAYSLYNLAYAAGLAGGPLLTGISTGLWGFTAAMVITAAALAAIGGASLARLPGGTHQAK